MQLNKRVVRGSVLVFYLLVGLEIVIMISPFAAYFYGVYGPLLNWLYSHPATAWLTGFFLPHAVVANSAVLNFMNALGRTLFSVGILAFLFGAVQIYSAKFRRKGVVTGLLYRWVRHPQYLFLAIAGFGLLLFWPRFFILILYVTMLFVYYLLARHEEQRMLNQYGESYRAYMQRTAMFLPGNPGAKLFRLLFGWVKQPGLALALAYVTVLVLSVAAAFGLRKITIANISLAWLPQQEIAAISITPRSEDELRALVESALADSAVNEALAGFREQGHRGFLVHVMPQHYMMQGLFLQPQQSSMPGRGRSWRGVLGFLFPFFSGHSHHDMMMRDTGGPVQMVVSQLTWPDGRYAAFDQALAFTVKHLPLLKLDFEPATGQVLVWTRTPPRNYWGQMPMPAY